MGRIRRGRRLRLRRGGVRSSVEGMGMLAGVLVHLKCVNILAMLREDAIAGTGLMTGRKGAWLGRVLILGVARSQDQAGSAW
jgi:hypothetical protein